MKAANGTITTFAVEAKSALEPRDVERLVPGAMRTVRELAGNIPVLVVAPWLSKRTQELLTADDINFIDLTGNARIELANPTVYISSSGAERNPAPTPAGRARVTGNKAARLVRLLADVRPPYGVRELAEAAQLTPGYVSRLLDALDREALIERPRRGPVESVDVPALLRRWAESYDVLRTNEAQTFIAPEGISNARSRLGALSATERSAVTGSFAAARLAPVAAPALLVVYCETVPSVAKALGLMPADDGANVALLRPFDSVVWERTSMDDGVRYVAPSQAVVDCLTGTGRMPAEGEAVLEWMAQDESRWRLGSLADAVPAPSAA